MSQVQAIAFSEALRILRDVGAGHRTGLISSGLREARGAVLAGPVRAALSLPPFANSAMDGFALRGADLAADGETCLRLVGAQFAGPSLGLALAAGECVRITTGAPMPANADTVAMKENARLEQDLVWIAPGLAQGTHVRQSGEDCDAGDLLLEAGVTLGSAAIGLLAATGLARVDVASRPTVAVFTTGDELRPAGTALAPGEIHDSNRLLLQSLLAEEGIDTLAWPALADEPERIRSAIDDASQAFDLIITCGGVSVGEKDHLPALLAANGRIHFWKVLMRPGMPVLFGQWGRALLVGLPGNPVSVLATFRCLVRPLLDAMQGRSDRAPPLRARLGESVAKSHARLEFRRARLACAADGVLVASAHPAAGSHQQRGAAESNALLLLPEECRDLAAGTIVEVEPYGPILQE